MQLASTIPVQHQRSLEAELRDVEDVLVQQAPSSMDAAMRRAELLIHLNREEDAVAALEEILEQDMLNGKALWLLSCLAPNPDDIQSGQSDTLQRMIAKESLSYKAQGKSVCNLGLVHSLYALGLLEERQGNHDKAFKWLRDGADIMKASLKDQTPILDDWLKPELPSTLREVLTPEWFRHKPAGLLGKGPVFLVGMPGAGLAYIEALLTRHPDIHAGGALPYFAEQVNKLVLQDPKAQLTCDIVRRTAMSDMHDLGVNYMISSRNERGERPYFIDRQSRNFLYLPFIAAALPDAKIIHVRRCPLDTCLVDYKWLYPEGHQYSYDFDSLSEHYALYDGIMDHYSELLGYRVFNVDYEAIVGSPKESVGALYDYIGVERLDDYKPISAPSMADKFLSLAEEPLCSGETGLWRRYENQITPLINALRSNGIDVQVD